MIEPSAARPPQTARSGALRICVPRTRCVEVLPAMSRRDWAKLPACVKAFVPWKEARTSKLLYLPTDEMLTAAVEYFCGDATEIPD